MEKSVSVVVPLYNSEKTILTTLESILGQSYEPTEIVLVDDGSIDATYQVCMDFIATFSNIKIIQQKNSGVGAARNRGIREARGEYIAFCDHDDLWHPEKLTLQMELFDSKEVGLVYAGVNERRVGSERGLLIKESQVYFEGYCFDQLLYKNTIPSISVVVPRHVFQHVGFFSESRKMLGADDRNMWLRIAHNYKIRAVKVPLVTHLITGQNWSLNQEKMLSASLACIADISQRFDFSTPHRRQLLRKAYGEIYWHFGQNFFHTKNYRFARRCILRALSKGRINMLLIEMLIGSCLPPVWLECLKPIVRLPVSSDRVSE